MLKNLIVKMNEKSPQVPIHSKNTCQLINNIPEIKTAFFSVFTPNTHTMPHRGPYKGVLRFHLALIIPEKCVIKINDITYSWQAEKSILFDDTFIHEA